jgi:hypothetical protein
MENLALCQCGHSIQQHKTIVNEKGKLNRFCDNENEKCECKVFVEYNDRKKTEQVKRKVNDSFRLANDIRYKNPKDLKPYQLPLFYELKIMEEIEALNNEIELEEFNKSLKVKGEGKT